MALYILCLQDNTHLRLSALFRPFASKAVGQSNSSDFPRSYLLDSKTLLQALLVFTTALLLHKICWQTLT
jgi:hypothetical protein